MMILSGNKNCKLSDCKDCPSRETKVKLGTIKCPMYEELVEANKNGGK